MLFRSLVAATALLAAAPAWAQEATPQAGDRPDIAAGAAQFIKPTNAERTQVLVGFLTTLGLTPQVQTFAGGNKDTGPMQGSNVVVTVGQGDKDIVLTAHYDAVKLRDGSLSHGIVDNVGSVMAMMEAAKTLDMALEGQPVSHRFVFVFTDQEELGLLGAVRGFADAGGGNGISQQLPGRGRHQGSKPPPRFCVGAGRPQPGQRRDLLEPRPGGGDLPRRGDRLDRLGAGAAGGVGGRRT